MSVLLRSQIECPECGDIVASINRHDFQLCKCGATAIDGGRDYLRIVGNWPAAIAEAEGSIKRFTHAIFIDGEHNLASQAAALRVYKALWRASAGHQPPHPDYKAVMGARRWATTSEIYGETASDTRRSLVAYLKTFLSSEEPCVERRRGAQGWEWRPLVPLVERSDAP